MVFNSYMIETLLQDRIKEAREWASEVRLLRELDGDVRRGLRPWVGLLLIRLGRALAGPAVRRAAQPRRAGA